MILSLITFSCKSTKDKSDKKTNVNSENIEMKKIETGNFSIIRIDGLKEISKNPVLKLDFIKNKVSGNSACNLYGGDFTTKENNIKFKALMSTRRYCEEFNNIETQYLKMLSTVTKYEIKDKSILFFNVDSKIVIIGELIE